MLIDREGALALIKVSGQDAMGLERLRREAEDAIARSDSSAALERVRIRYLGRKADLPNLLRGVAELPAQERAATGKAANEARQSITEQFERRAGELAERELQERLTHDRIDVTLPGPRPWVGHAHVLAQIRDELLDLFHGLGFSVYTSPEVELDAYNFGKLNFAPDHPARDAQ